MKDDPARYRDYLFLCLHTMLRPLRSDFGHVEIYINKAPTDEDIKWQPNYITVVKQLGAEAFEEGSFVLNDYKKRQGSTRSIELPLPPPLLEVLHRSLELQPRAHVLTRPDCNLPWSISQSYTNWANRLLLRVFGKRVTTSLLRHSYINSLNMNSLSIREKKGDRQGYGTLI